MTGFSVENFSARSVFFRNDFISYPWTLMRDRLLSHAVMCKNSVLWMCLPRIKIILVSLVMSQVTKLESE